MEGKKTLSKLFESFIGGRGFYIVLFACVAVIGVSAWLVFSPVAGERDYVPVSGPLEDITDPTEGLSQPPAQEQLPVSAPGEAFVPEVVPREIVKEPEVLPADGKGDGDTVPASARGETEEERAARPRSFEAPVSGRLLNPYSPEDLIYSKTMADWRTHDGVDIACRLGDLVAAMTGGTVLSVEADDLMGTTVTIDHGQGLVGTYANLAAEPVVKAGDAVDAGAVIGSVGDTALLEIGEGTHLHFALALDGVSVNPGDYVESLK